MSPELIAKLINVFEHAYALVSELPVTYAKLENDTTLAAKLDDGLELVKEAFNAISNKGTVNENDSNTPTATDNPAPQYLGGTGEQGQQ